MGSLTHLVVNWLLSALSLLLVAQVIPGIQVAGFGSALAAAVIIGLVNATVGFVLKILTFPLTLITLGLFLWVINALMLKLAAALAPGFRVHGCLPALLGALALSILNTLLRWLVWSL
ncbi:MAG: phage holin family protein [Bryobacterales bacterium]|nr:phage holin family protein [Bryobacterales bacterium]